MIVIVDDELLIMDKQVIDKIIAETIKYLMMMVVVIRQKINHWYVLI